MPLQVETKEDFSPVSLLNGDGKSPVLIVCEHASNRIPCQYSDLGLSTRKLKSHIAWDPGADKVASYLSKLFDAPYVRGDISRLVYDCNRPPSAIDAMPSRSEIFDVPGNMNLEDIERRQRIQKVYLPFHQCLEDALATSELNCALITIHSFTRVYNGQDRDVELGILHDKDSRLADAILSAASVFTSLNVQRNQPYGPENGVTHTLREHGLKNGLLNVMLEIRNDLLTTSEQCGKIAEMLHGLLLHALKEARGNDQLQEQNS
ncbi:MAG: N-formylglutamate amidohydrolase [Rhizobiaceae bacterium]